MSPVEENTVCRWLWGGDEMFPEMLAAIEAAQASVCLETYVFTASPLGVRFLEALVRAQQRGARVRVLVDAVGSFGLPDSFWEPLRNAGGEARQFNPLALNRVWIRSHRKLLVCDGRVAFVGGFNIAPEYEGDGVSHGWRDIGLRLEGVLAAQLVLSFEETFTRADFRHRRFARRPRLSRGESAPCPAGQLLFSGPGRDSSRIKRALRADLAGAREVRIMTAYFLPTWRLRRDLVRVARRGGRVQLILAGKSDVPLSQLAGQSLYRRFLKGDVEIFEYQPQVLHAKLMILDDVVYAGSANLDQRSLEINYELMIRFQNRRIAGQAREFFDMNLRHCRRVEFQEWRASRTLWQKLKQRLAYLLLVRIDPYLARRQWRALPE